MEIERETSTIFMNQVSDQNTLAQTGKPWFFNPQKVPKTSFRKLELDQKLEIPNEIEKEDFVKHTLMHLTAKETKTLHLSEKVKQEGS